MQPWTQQSVHIGLQGTKQERQHSLSAGMSALHHCHTACPAASGPRQQYQHQQLTADETWKANSWKVMRTTETGRRQLTRAHQPPWHWSSVGKSAALTASGCRTRSWPIRCCGCYITTFIGLVALLMLKQQLFKAMMTTFHPNYSGQDCLRLNQTIYENSTIWRLKRLVLVNL